MPENGGWSQDNFTVAVGQALNLKIVSDDVVHGFAIGQQTEPDIELMPGVIQNVSLSFDQPGTYIFYCTRWCGPNHWRMRGKIEVTGGPVPTPGKELPLFISNNLDIDQEHDTVQIPEQLPKISLEPINLDLLPEWAREYKQIWLQSPGETFNRWKKCRDFKEKNSEQSWDLTAQIYYQQTSQAGLLESKSTTPSSVLPVTEKAGAEMV